MKTVPNKGDYVRIKKIPLQDYNIICSSFIDAGFDSGQYPYQNYHEWSFVGDAGGELFHSDSALKFTGRELTIADLIGPEEEECFPAVGEKCNFETRDYMGECIISYIGIDHVLFIGCATNKEYAAGKDKVKFSPIKSEREKCVEEIIEIITRGKTVNNGYRSIAECIYDSGRWK